MSPDDLLTVNDESSLLHLALLPEHFDQAIISQIIARSANLELQNDRGMTPLEASLAYGYDDVSIALVTAGAAPRFLFGGDSYLSAEVYYQLLQMLKDFPGHAQRVATEALKQYERAIDEARYAIESNEASIYAKRIVNVIGPVLQMSLASMEANYKATQAAKTSPYGFGVGVAVYTTKHFDTQDPAQAILALQDRITHCENRRAQLDTFLQEGKEID
jgi:hypothetical protein